MHRHLAVVALALVIVAPGCKKKPTDVNYSFVTTAAELDGATLHVGGTTRLLQFNAYTHEASVGLLLKSDAPAAVSSLSVDLDTPCGKKNVALVADMTADEEMLRRKNTTYMRVKISAASALPAAMTVWVDAGSEKSTVDVGAAQLHHGKNRLFDYECKTPVEARLGGQSLGTLPALDTQTKAVFVSAKPSACYAFEDVLYTTAPGVNGGRRRVFRDSHVYGLPIAEIEYFLTTAPSSMKGGPTSVRELTSIPCARD